MWFLTRCVKNSYVASEAVGVYFRDLGMRLIIKKNSAFGEEICFVRGRQEVDGAIRLAVVEKKFISSLLRRKVIYFTAIKSI